MKRERFVRFVGSLLSLPIPMGKRRKIRYISEVINKIGNRFCGSINYVRSHDKCNFFRSFHSLVQKKKARFRVNKSFIGQDFESALLDTISTQL